MRIMKYLEIIKPLTINLINTRVSQMFCNILVYVSLQHVYHEAVPVVVGSIVVVDVHYLLYMLCKLHR